MEHEIEPENVIFVNRVEKLHGMKWEVIAKHKSWRLEDKKDAERKAVGIADYFDGAAIITVTDENGRVIRQCISKNGEDYMEMDLSEPLRNYKDEIDGRLSQHL